MSSSSTYGRVTACAAIDQGSWSSARFPLGAHLQGNTCTFAVFSRAAERVLLELYAQPTGADASFAVWMEKNPGDHIWRAHLTGVEKHTLYGFRCWGPNWPYRTDWQRGGSNRGFGSDVDSEGHRFNPNKLLHDPYARELSHDRDSPSLSQAGHDKDIFATGPHHYQGRPRREVDTGRYAPKGLVVDDHTDTGNKPRLPEEKALIYEAHLRGLSRHPSSTRLKELLVSYPEFAGVENVPAQYRGTYRGAAYLAQYLAALGMTTVEFLPVHEFDNESNPEDRPGGNYWGYMTQSYFAPDRRYSSDPSPGGPTREFKEMIRAFHQAGLEVYLDVVYNHTGEGGHAEDKDTVAFTHLGGFDVGEYYHLTEDRQGLVSGATGCGNQLNFSNEMPRRLVLDSIAYFTEVMGVDGFRFDLAPVLGRLPEATHPSDWDGQKRFYRDHELITSIAAYAKSQQIEVIAEAWDLWGYQVGNFADGWGEWNGRFRDAVRRFLKGDGNATQFICHVNGDYDHFVDQGGPARSVNFVVAHDGFTLADLVSYAQKHNAQCAWPFGPSDGGADDNASWDSGGDPTLRRQRIRNFWAILFLSRGVPMVVWGDELGRTQNGNNNPYNVDSIATWNNYDMLTSNAPQRVGTGCGQAYHDNLGVADCEAGKNPLFVFARFMIELRRSHPALSQRQYGDFTADNSDVSYLFFTPDGRPECRDGDHAVLIRIDGSGIKDSDWLVMVNMDWRSCPFVVPGAAAGKQWVRIVDTAAWAEPFCNVWRPGRADTISGEYRAHPYSVVILEEVTV